MMKLVFVGLLLCVAAAGVSKADLGDAPLYASYRKDYFYGRDRYREPDSLPLPESGGRMHIVGVSSGSGTVEAIRIDGQTVTTGGSGYDWVHVYPGKLAVGMPFWVSFHSQ